jgi:hypothetical protein
MSSWVKLSRKLATSAIASKPEYLAVWVHLLLSASYKEGEILVGRQVVRLNPGQLVFGRHKFSEKTGVSESIVRAALKVLESLQQITIKSHSKFSVITITKWSHYQIETPADNQQVTSKRPADDHNKEIQEIQEQDKQLLSSGDDEGKKRIRKKDETPYELFIATYQARCAGRLKPAEKLNDKRKAAIRRAWNFKARDQLPFRQDGFLERYLDKLMADPFKTGQNPTGWRADIEYAFREKTMTDVIGV